MAIDRSILDEYFYFYESMDNIRSNIGEVNFDMSCINRSIEHQQKLLSENITLEDSILFSQRIKVLETLKDIASHNNRPYEEGGLLTETLMNEMVILDRITVDLFSALLYHEEPDACCLEEIKKIQERNRKFFEAEFSIVSGWLSSYIWMECECFRKHILEEMHFEGKMAG